jgi:hypothetical protein
VLRNETHFAPVPQPSPLLQISERISAEIETLPASTPAFADAALTRRFALRRMLWHQGTIAAS